MKGRININRPTTSIQRVVLPRVGFIKVGYKEKATNGKEYPKSVDYFIANGKYVYQSIRRKAANYSNNFPG